MRVKRAGRMSDAIPPPISRFVGRRDAIVSATELLARPDIRLVTLFGPGGVVKTRLALELADRLLKHFADGVYTVALDAVTDPALVLPMVGRSLGLLDDGGAPVTARIAAALDGKHALLVLDNLEQVVDAAPAIADVLRAVPGLTVLATSRSVLGVSGEHIFPLEPMPVPGEGATTPAALADNDAVLLFVTRAAAARAGFVLDEGNAAAVAHLCARLEGLPLAIELAAARIRSLSPAALLAQLTDRLGLLTGGARDQPPRLRSLRGAIAWSYDLLDAGEQRLLLACAVCEGGVSLDVAAALLGDPDDGDGAGRSPVGAGPDPAAPIWLIDALSSLVDQSLLRPIAAPDDRSVTRCIMLESVRAFCLEALAGTGDEARLRDRHAAVFADLAVRAAPHLFGGRTQRVWLDRLETEHDNLRAALAWTLRSAQTEGPRRLAGALFWFWYVRGYAGEGRIWLARVLAAERGAASLGSAQARIGAGMLAHRQGDDAAALPLLEAGLGLTRTLGDPVLEVLALGLIGVVEEDRGQYEPAITWLRAALDVLETAGEAQPAALTALTIAHLGVATWGAGDLAAAAAYWRDALTRHRADGDRFGIANAVGFLGLAAIRDGNLPDAASLLSEGLTLAIEIDATDEIAGGLANAAVLAVARGRPRDAALLLGASESVRCGIGSVARDPERAVYAETERAAAAALGESWFGEARRAGEAGSLDEAIAVAAALFGADAPAESAPGPAPDVRLTTRERDVLLLLGASRSDREIAAALGLSPRTVQGHVARLFTKLGAHSRSEAVAIALQLGLAQE